jgi:hypothetical protein
MLSLTDPSIVYETARDATEHDIDVVSDLWTMGNRKVYRGARDPRYTHANVYWLYDEELDRVGLAEHTLANAADVALHWYYDSPFGTLLQEEKWTVDDPIWSKMAEHTYERFLTEGWTDPSSFLEQCLSTPTRIVTPDMLITLPTVHACPTCKKKSLKPFACATVHVPLDFPDKEKIWFIDDSMNVSMPPPVSCVFTRLQQLRASSLQPASLPEPRAGEPESQPEEQEPQPQQPPL